MLFCHLHGRRRRVLIYFTIIGIVIFIFHLHVENVTFFDSKGLDNGLPQRNIIGPKITSDFAAYQLPRADVLLVSDKTDDLDSKSELGPVIVSNGDYGNDLKVLVSLKNERKLHDRRRNDNLIQRKPSVYRKNGSRVSKNTTNTSIRVRAILHQKIDDYSASQSDTLRRYTNVTVSTEKGIPIIENKILWSKELEENIPKGYSNVAELNSVTDRLRSRRVSLIQPASWNRCGGFNNKFVTLDDGTSACVRYRHPHIKLIVGEVLSYHFAKLLGLDNVPAVTLSILSPHDAGSQWSKTNISSIGWNEGTIVAFIHWIENLNSEGSRLKIPDVLMRSYENISELDYRNKQLPKIDWTTLNELVQWTDLVIFDYITGNYDRIASMQDGAYNEKNPDIMHEPIRNLRRSVDTGSMWFFDNESGFFDAYELMHHGNSLFRTFHEQMLQSICIFRQRTADRVSKLASRLHPVKYLLDYAQDNEPLFSTLLSEIEHHKYFHKDFRERIQNVHSWINKCKYR